MRDSASTPITCLVCGQFGVVDIFLNILLFVPFGFGLRLAGRPRLKAFLLASGTSLCIELLQMNIIAGRDASLSDLLTNSLGGALGIWLADYWRVCLLPSPAACRRLRLAAGLGWLWLWFASARLVQPDARQTGWFGQLAAQGVLYDDFKGNLLRATVNQAPIDSVRLNPADSARLYDAFVAHSVAVTATVITGPATRFPAPIVSIYDQGQKEILVLGQDHSDLIFRLRLGTEDHELHLPEISLPGALAPAGDTVEVRGGLERGRLYVSARASGQFRERDAGLSPSWGWMFFMPWHYAMGPEARWLTALWIGGLLFPVAFWAARGAHSARDFKPELAFLALIVGLGLGVAPLLAMFPPVNWSEWLASIAGIGAGWRLGRFTLTRYPAAAR